MTQHGPIFLDRTDEIVTATGLKPADVAVQRTDGLLVNPHQTYQDQTGQPERQLQRSAENGFGIHDRQLLWFSCFMNATVNFGKESLERAGDFL